MLGELEAERGLVITAEVGRAGRGVWGRIGENVPSPFKVSSSVTTVQQEARAFSGILEVFKNVYMDGSFLA